MLLRYFLLKRMAPIEHLSKRAVMRSRASSVKTGFPGTDARRTPSPRKTKTETMGDFLCRQDERRRSYQAPSADSSDDDVDDTTLSGRAHLLCCERCNRSFNPPLSRDPSSRAAKSVEDDTP